MKFNVILMIYEFKISRWRLIEDQYWSIVKEMWELMGQSWKSWVKTQLVIQSTFRLTASSSSDSLKV